MADNNFELSSPIKGLQVLRGKEGYARVAYIVGGVIAALFGGYYLLPYAILALENILYTAVLAVVVFIVGYVLVSDTFWNSVIYFLDNMLLRMENLVIESDPFSTAQNAIKKLNKRLQEMVGYLTSLRGSEERQKKELAALAVEKEDFMRKGAYALKNGDQEMASRFSNQAQNRQDAISRLTPIFDRTVALRAFIDQLHNRVENRVAEAQDSLDLALREFKITKDSDDAIKAAQRAMSGDDAEMFRRSMEVISEKTFKMVGEVEFFMDTTRPLIEMDKISNAVKSEKALDALREWMDRDTGLMNKQDKAALALSAGDPNLFVSTETVTAKSGSPVKVRANGNKTGGNDIADKYDLD